MLFCPMFAGLALGNANINAGRCELTISMSHPVPALPYRGTSSLTDTPIPSDHGYTAGLGVDIMLFVGLFLRAEWEYIRFTAQVDTSINTVRAGLGYKF